MSGLHEFENDCGEILELAKKPLSKPFNIVLLAMIIGIAIGTCFALLGLHGINFVLFAAVIAGGIYAKDFEHPIPKSMYLKTSFYYYILGFFISMIVAYLKPDLLPINSIDMFLFLICVLFFESIIFTFLLHFGGVLYLKAEEKKKNIQSV
ncbi:MAG: hypothetical protein PHV37_02920 [Candidatus Gastranaerophilales bacterium]|nr:hypothetical protein [Candidatus Gastranaerophilales bacterium]